MLPSPYRRPRLPRPPKRESSLERAVLIGVFWLMMWGLFKVLDPLSPPVMGDGASAIRCTLAGFESPTPRGHEGSWWPVHTAHPSGHGGRH